MLTLLEQKLISSYKTDLIFFLKTTPELFNEAIGLAISEKQPFSWRAAWLISNSMEINDSKIKPHYPKIVKCLMGKSSGHQRELLKILEKLDSDEESEGYLFDFCLNLWEQLDKQPSVRFSALKFIIKMAEKYPDLKKELDFITQKQYIESLSKGIKCSANKLLSSISNREDF